MALTKKKHHSINRTSKKASSNIKVNNKYNLVYMAKPPYGGWVSFTAHLSKKYGYELYKIGNKTEKNKRPYGYEVEYQNISIDELIKKGNILITAVDKKYYQYLPQIRKATIVIHDPTELKEPVLDALKRFNVITIRKTVQELLKKVHNINSKFILHPFYEFPKRNISTNIVGHKKSRAISISRVDFDKHTDIILKANKKLKKPIEIYGAVNDLYVYHGGLNELNFKKYYKGKFDKSFETIYNMLRDVKFVVDMSAIKNDGGGSQYTFLEAIYMNCALVLSDKWTSGTKTLFKDKVNCFIVKDEEELAKLLNSNPDTSKIVKNAKKMLTPHLRVKW